jgi:hypothetical protein
MADAIAVLDDVSAQIAELSAELAKKQIKFASPPRTQSKVRSMASTYFEFSRPELERTICRDGLVSEFDATIQKLIDISSQSCDKKVFIGLLSELRPLALEATVHLMKSRGVPRLLLSETERGIVATLDRMLPGSRNSYEQVLRDITQQGGRVSWRGTAAELRDVLREVMDHLAPDEKVVAAPNFALEKDRVGPTQAQKVRFILKARRAGKAAIATAEGTLQTVDEAVAALARTTYTRGSASAHTSPEAGEIRKLKRYVDALLGELLELA